MMSLFLPLYLLQGSQEIYSRVYSLLTHLTHLCNLAPSPDLRWPHSLSRLVNGSCWDVVCAEAPVGPGGDLSSEVSSLWAASPVWFSVSE